MRGLLGVAGRAVIRRPDGRVLLIRRPVDAKTDAGLWEMPGGKMSYGESLVDALAREVVEETGLAVEPGAVLHVSHRMVDPFWVTIITLDCGHSDQDVMLSDEHSDHIWASIDDLENLVLTEETSGQLRAARLLWGDVTRKGRPG